ncbi:Asp-tRNA(Asn)/Glu-tRNA(Gln) amidotransferase subunit GatB [Candidatus Saccharibacteria bacterium]|nr:Asp-tRNA(Asn)/Glu-tRNA(Gln) amidotransferase subunit GatB [Candidatus Saccharibacteria bacterium]
MTPNVPATKTTYLPTIGIECHVQLNTKTKLFAAVGNDARGASPNTLISHICVGMPGALPVLNEKAVELAVGAAFALNSQPQAFSKFDRKHYFYPDLPKGYQITQYDQPIAKGGYVEIEIEGEKKKVGITRVHLEEDAGKTTHPEGMDFSLIDLNRAGTPLLEIVSEPEIYSPAEAKAYARELWLVMKYAQVTDGDLYHGHVRFDVNISVSDKPGMLGTRTEIKNLNSFRSVAGAVEYEIKRQAELLEKNEVIVQETRGWDEVKQKTTPQRQKEEAHDYRYMPEPDIPPLKLSASFISKVKEGLPELPSSIRESLSELQVDPKVIEDILDREELLDRVLEVKRITKSTEHTRRVLFQLLDDPDSLSIHVKDQIKVLEMISIGELSSTAAKAVLKERIKIEEDPRLIAERMNLLQISNESELEIMVREVLADNPTAVADVKKGEAKAVGFLVGQVMKKAQGKANPEITKRLIKKQLDV